MSQTADVDADLNYLMNTGVRPVNYAITPHTSFQDPSPAPDASPRRSSEVRTLVFWD